MGMDWTWPIGTSAGMSLTDRPGKQVVAVLTHSPARRSASTRLRSSKAGTCGRIDVSICANSRLCFVQDHHRPQAYKKPDVGEQLPSLGGEKLAFDNRTSPSARWVSVYNGTGRIGW